jgi:hypothetical protein
MYSVQMYALCDVVCASKWEPQPEVPGHVVSWFVKLTYLVHVCFGSFDLD